uniref:Peptidase A1 domain-containing protein n=1 Tax=Kalanchoe fedtschenkoi TaxID=63787 RepID=A0A7N0TAV8_KALFE
MAGPNSFIHLALFLFCLLAVFGFGSSIRQSHERGEAETHRSLLLSSLLPSAACDKASPTGLKTATTLDLTHKHGPCSPLGPKSQTSPAQILQQDKDRVNWLHSRLTTTIDVERRSGRKKRPRLSDSAVTVPARDGSLVSSGNFIVTVNLGTPPRPLNLIFDTGSDVTWTQCQPCAKFCHKQLDPIFDPAKSATYSNVSCEQAVCQRYGDVPGVSRGCSASTCLYGIQYGDKSFSVGFLAKEKIAIGRDSFDDFYFGCGQNNLGLFGGSAGLLGLGRDEFSFVSQTASKYGKFFSYCLPSTPSNVGKLTFGKGGYSNRVKFTSLLTKPELPSFYFVDVVGVSVGGKKLTIPASIFSSAGTLIDSGTVISRLPPTAYAAIRAEFRKQMSRYKLTEALSLLDTCYDFSNFTTISVPKVSFVFGGGVELAVAPAGVLYGGSKKQICLALAGNGDDGDVAILGNVQQMTQDVVYDVAGGKLGFGSGGCR